MTDRTVRAVMHKWPHHLLCTICHTPIPAECVSRHLSLTDLLPSQRSFGRVPRLALGRAHVAYSPPLHIPSPAGRAASLSLVPPCWQCSIMCIYSRRCLSCQPSPGLIIASCRTVPYRASNLLQRVRQAVIAAITAPCSFQRVAYISSQFLRDNKAPRLASADRPRICTGER